MAFRSEALRISNDLATLALLAAFTVSAGLFGAACVVNEGAPAATGVVVNAPPPEPMREQRPVAAQRVGGEWVAGYWHWNGMQYTWIPGHWEKAPPGQTWHAPRYSMRDGGTYLYEPGGWR